MQNKNKEIIRRVYQEIFNGHKLALTKDLFKEDYIQHNPRVEPGRAGFDKFFQKMFAQFPNFRLDIKHMIAEGDYVVVHIHAVGTNASRGAAVVDIYRLENGKLAEHWDVIQPIPEDAINSMF